MKHTVIPHTNELLSLSVDKKVLRLRDTLADGLIVEHTISAGNDEVDFRLVAQSPMRTVRRRIGRSRVCGWELLLGSALRLTRGISTIICRNASFFSMAGLPGCRLGIGPCARVILPGKSGVHEECRATMSIHVR